MITVGSEIVIKGYDYDQMQFKKRRFEVLAIYPHYVLTRHKKAGYRECFGTYELIQNGYIPNFKDVYDERGFSNQSKYDSSNSLLNGY